MISDLPGWDPLPAVTRYHNWAEMAGIIAVAVLVVAEIIQFKYGHRRDDLIAQEQTATNQRHDEEMARLHLDTAQSNARAAEATQKAAEAQLELAKFKAPRTLSVEQQAKIAEKLRPFAGTLYDAGIGPAGDPEPLYLLRSIHAALSQAGWVQIAWTEQGAQTYTEPPMPAVGLTMVTNVIVDVNPNWWVKYGPAARALAAALAAEGVAAISIVNLSA